MLSTHTQISNPAPQDSPAPGWCACVGRQPHILIPAFTNPSPHMAVATSLFLPSGPKEGMLEATSAWRSWCRTVLGSTCLSYPCISSGFPHIWLGASRSQPGKQLCAQDDFSLPKLSLLGAEAGNGLACSSTRSVAQLRQGSPGQFNGSCLVKRGQDLATQHGQQERQPGQSCSTKPSSLCVALAAIAFPRRFAADLHPPNASSQPSDFRLVTGHCSRAKPT